MRTHHHPRIVTLAGAIAAALTLAVTGDVPAPPRADAFAEEGIRRVLVTTVTETTATIIWTTATAERGKVLTWRQEGPVVQVEDAEPAQHHSLTLRELHPGVVYHYVASGPSGVSYLSHFRTVGPLPGEPELTMAVVADPQFDGVESGGGRNFRKVVAEINERGADLVLFPGDLVDNRNGAGVIPDFTRDAQGYAKTFTAFRELAVGLRMPWYVAPGNHERLHEPGVRELYLRVFELTRAHYSLDCRGRHFISLDSGSTGLLAAGSEQFQWLAQDLDANRGKDVYVQLHHAVANDPYVFDRGRGVFPHLQKLFEEHGRVRAVYNGHKNVISATVQNGILYVSCPQPSGVAPGYLMVKVYATGLVQTFHRTPGAAGLAEPSAARRGELVPDRLRWDSMYRHGPQGARNFSWRFGAPTTSTRMR